MNSAIKILTLTCILLEVVTCQDVSREKRDDANKFIVTTILEEPYVKQKSPHGSGNENFDGLIPEMMRELSDKLKLDYEFRLVDDNKYGVKENGRWNGMIGEIVNGVADMSAAPMTISSDRAEVVDFTEPFESFGTVLLMLKPKEGETLTIKNMDDLANQDEIKYGIVKNGVTENFFSSSNIATYSKMWENIEDNPQNMVSSVSEGVQKVRDSEGKFAFIIESATAEYWVDKAPCNLQIVGKKINSNGFAFALKKNDDNVERFNEAIVEMRETGRLHELRRKWKKGECGNTIDDDKSSATSMFALSGIMVVFSTLTSQIL